MKLYLIQWVARILIILLKRAVNGTVVTIATRSTHDLSFTRKGLSLHVTFMALKYYIQINVTLGEILTKLTQIVEEGHLRPLLDSKPFTFDEVAQAHEYLESNKAIGKIVLKTFGNNNPII